MARVIQKLNPKKRVMPGRGGFGDKVKIKAFNLFTELTPNLRQKFSIAEIARKIKVSRGQLHRWVKEGRWRERLDVAFDKAKKQTANKAELLKLIKDFAKDDDVVGITDLLGKELQTFEAVRDRRLLNAMRTMGNVLYEVRSYNVMMHRMLVGSEEQVKKIKERLGLGLSDREKIHKAWTDSTRLLMDLFTSSNLRALAMEKIPVDMFSSTVRDKILSAEENQKGTKITINSGGKGGDESATAVLTDSTHELILNIMTGKTDESSFPIEPPSFHPKYDRSDSAEDAQVIKSGSIDEDGEGS